MRRALVMMMAVFGVLNPFTVAQCSFSKIVIKGGSVPHGEGVNKFDTVVGTYTDNATQQSRGFRWNGGHLTAYNYPGAMATAFHGNNDLGAIVGEFTDASKQTHGLELFQGQALVIDYPGAQTTRVRGINNAGTIVGSFVKPGETLPHGFMKSTAGWKQVDFPQSTFTELTGINVFGDVVGTFHIAVPGTHTFMMLADGTSTFIDYPGAISTIGTGINRWRSVVGYYLLSDVDPNPPGAFTRSVNNSFYILSEPFPATATGEGGVNNQGDKTGWVTVDGKSDYAFLKVCVGD